MKDLRYLLSMIVLVSSLNLYAQGSPYSTRYHSPYQSSYGATMIHSQTPQARMHSTSSSMMSSGSTISMAARSGVMVTGNTIGSYTPVNNAPGRPRRVGENEGFEEDEDDPDNPGEPQPIGDTLCLIFFVLLAAIYRSLRSMLGSSR